MPNILNRRLRVTGKAWFKMKKQTFLKTAATAFLFMVFCLTAGGLRADPGSDSLSNAEQQAKMDDRARSKSGDQDL